MTHQQMILYLHGQYCQLSDSCEQWASFTTDPAFAQLLRRQAALYHQFAGELGASSVTATREQLKATVEWLAALYLQRDDALVAGACYRAMKPLISFYQNALTDPKLPKDLQQLISRHYRMLDQGATVLHRMMTV